MGNEATRICAVVAEETTGAARDLILRAGAVADLIEVRLDYLRDFDFSSPEKLRVLLDEKPLPVIITCRAASEGGMQEIEDEIRLNLLVEGARRMADYCDIEAASYDKAARLSPDISRLVVSYHNFDETPAGLDSIYDSICRLPAAVYKIATRARSVTDTLAIFRLLDRARSEDRRLIALAMDGAGLITRLIGPSRGSFLSYGALARGALSAPGQPTCEDLKRLYRIDRITRSTEITGIIGHPVSHSASPAMHNRAFQARASGCVYLPIEVSDLEAFVVRFVRPSSREIDWNLRGLSVTIPHKTAVLDLLDDSDEVAREVGSVNTIVVEEDRVKGYNTDVKGAIEPLLGAYALKGEHCAVIGAGGVARAVIYGLIRCGAQVSIFARDVERARQLVASFGKSSIERIDHIDTIASSSASVLINATPIGMRGHSEGRSPVPCEVFEGRSVAYDLVYNPLETRFLKEAQEAGCKTISGIEMLVSQAASQFELWTGERPSLALMRDAALSFIRDSAIS